MSADVEKRPLALPSAAPNAAAPPAVLASAAFSGKLQALANDCARLGELPPKWQAATEAAAELSRMLERLAALRSRLDSPLVVVTFGGTGTGKSSLVNALLGAQVVPSGKERPTTTTPMVVAHPRADLKRLRLDEGPWHVIRQELPALRDFLIVDCPDPDTAEDAADAESNTARLKRILPYCDVLLVTATQQKYRSAKVTQELLQSLDGARVLFVQTHADTDDDIRADWGSMLAEDLHAGEIYLVDSRSALDRAQKGLPPEGDFARLVDLLTRELSGEAATRIRQANMLDLITGHLAACDKHLHEGLPQLEKLEAAILRERQKLASLMAKTIRDELFETRQGWESRLLSEVSQHWGASPFALVLRIGQGLGGLLASAALLRVRTPAQLALWGAVEGVRRVRQAKIDHASRQAPKRAACWGWGEADLNAAGLILEGFARDAGLPTADLRPERLQHQSQHAAQGFVDKAAADLQSLVRTQAARHSGWFTRLVYEFLFIVVAGGVLFRVGKNYFYDSWLGPLLNPALAPAPVLGVDFALISALWVVLWSALLLWAFTRRTRRGLETSIRQKSEGWCHAGMVPHLFSGIESDAQRALEYCKEFDSQLARARALQLELPRVTPRLGSKEPGRD